MPFEIPSNGYVLEPGSDQFGVAFNFGLEYDGSDRASVRGWVVDYEIQGNTYSEFFLSSLAVCPAKPCEPEERGVD